MMQQPQSVAPAGDKSSTEFSFSDAEFRAIADLAHSQFGLDLQEAKKALVYSRLSRRLRALGMRRFQDYLSFLSTADGASERTEMLSALTTNVTHFFREGHHFKILRDEILPPLIRVAKAGGRVRFWSAGCSAGQEPYSIAATLLDAFPDAARHDVKLLATDVDPVILARAQSAHYSRDETSAIPENLRKLMIRDVPTDATQFAVASEVRSFVSFGEINLIADWPMKGRFDAIFCRNVAIYFDKATQARLWRRFHDQLNPGGYLIIGHSERLSSEAATLFDTVGVTAFRRKDRDVTSQRPDNMTMETRP